MRTGVNRGQVSTGQDHLPHDSTPEEIENAVSRDRGQVSTGQDHLPSDSAPDAEIEEMQDLPPEPFFVSTGEIDEIASIRRSIRERIDNLSPRPRPGSVSAAWIFRVPERLRCLSPDLYTPKILSLGHGKECFQEMEAYKYRYLSHFLDRSYQTGLDLDYFIRVVRECEGTLRGCYGEVIHSAEFVRMIVVDAIFIIQIFLECQMKGRFQWEGIINSRSMIDDIRRDMLVVENQIPLHIIVRFFDSVDFGRRYPGVEVFDPKIETSPFGQLFTNFFKEELDAIGWEAGPHSHSFVLGMHVLDVIRHYAMPPYKPREKRKRVTAFSFAPSATTLDQAGIKLKLGSRTNLFCLQFTNGILEIPKVTISYRMELMLKNLAAFEQSYYVQDHDISDYMEMLDCLVNTPRDVELLVDSGTASNAVGDNNEASSLINGLPKGFIRDPHYFYFASLFADLEKHCKKPWNRWKTNLRQNYLNTPWAIVSVIAAVVLILLTIVQTVCSVISAKHDG